MTYLCDLLGDIQSSIFLREIQNRRAGDGRSVFPDQVDKVFLLTHQVDGLGGKLGVQLLSGSLGDERSVDSHTTGFGKIVSKPVLSITSIAHNLPSLWEYPSFQFSSTSMHPKAVSPPE